MSVPARSATRREAAGSICLPASATACFTSASACLRHLPQIEPARPWHAFRPQHSTIVALFCTLVEAPDSDRRPTRRTSAVVIGSGAPHVRFEHIEVCRPRLPSSASSSSSTLFPAASA